MEAELADYSLCSNLKTGIFEDACSAHMSRLICGVHNVFLYQSTNCNLIEEDKNAANISALTREQFDAEMEKGMADVKAGRVYSADTIEAEMKREFGVWAGILYIQHRQ